MSDLNQAQLSLPEAAYVVGIPQKVIDREIDAKVIASPRASERHVRPADILYLVAIKHVRDQIAPTLRKSLRHAIATAVETGEANARYGHVLLSMDELRRAVAPGFERLKAVEQYVERRPGVLGGEPVIKGTRVSVWHIANLSRQGMTVEELADDYEITAEQVEAAIVYDSTHPQRGRRSVKRSRTVHVPPAG